MLKFLKSSFAAVIALLAISATLATYATNLKKVAVDPGCYRTVEGYTPPAAESGVFEKDITPPVSISSSAQVGDELNPTTDCGGDERVCCIEVNSSNQVIKVFYEPLP